MGVFRPTLALLPFLAACSPEPVNTFDRLSISAGNDGEYRRPVNFDYPAQTRFLSMNGKMPIPAIASPCLASSFRSSNSIICFSRDGTTKVLERSYKFSGTMADLESVKTNLSKLVLELIDLSSESTESADSGESQQGEQGVTGSSTEATTSAAGTTSTSSEIVAGTATVLSQQLAKNNIFIFRWNSTSSQSGGGSLSTLLTGKSGAKQTESGIVIVGGLKVSQLIIGLADFPSQFDNLPDSTKIATLTFSAENLLYLSDNSIAAAISASFEGTPDELKALTLDTKIKLNAALQMASAAENQGAFTAPSYHYTNLSQLPETSDQIFYATMTDLQSLRDTIGNK